jgi:hypothetical protein
LFLGTFRGVALDGDVWPFWRVFGVELEPAFQTGFGVGLDGVGGAFGFANTAIDAFIGVDDQHVLAFVETIHRADFHAVHILALDAVLGDDVGHVGSIHSGITGGFLAERFGACISFFDTGQVLVKLVCAGCGSTLFGFPQYAHDFYAVAQGNGEDVLGFDSAAAFLCALAVDADFSIFNQVCGHRAVLHEARVDQPFVETLTQSVPLAHAGFQGSKRCEG